MRVFLTVYVLLHFSCYSFSQDKIWNKLLISEKARADFAVTKMVIDNFNNKYVASIVGGNESEPSNTYCYLYRYNEFDELVWTKKVLETPVSDELSTSFALAVDNRSNTYLGINFNKNARLYGEKIVSNGNLDALLISINRNGELINYKQIGGYCDEEIRVIDIDDKNNIYIGGYFGYNSSYEEDIDCNLSYEDDIFMGDNFSSPNYFLLQLDKEQNLIWHNYGGGHGSDILTGICFIDDKLYATIASTSLSEINLNGTLRRIPKRLDSNIFLVEINNLDGQVNWSKYLASSGVFNHIYPYSVVANNFSITLVANIRNGDNGMGNRLLIEDEQPLVWPGLGENDYFIINYDTAGKVNWTKQGFHFGRDYALDMVIDRKNNYYITGYVPNAFVFANDTLPTQGGNDIFVACYNANGEEQWIKTAGGRGNDTANSIALDRNGRIYVCGGTSSHPVTFGDITVEPPHPNNVFLARLSDDPILSILPINNNQTATAVYPNPATNRLWLQQNAGQQNISNLLLYDVAGNLVQQNFNAASTGGIDVQLLSAGIYFLNITYSNGEQQVVKFCKQ